MRVRPWHLLAVLAVVIVVASGMALLSQRNTDQRICEQANQALRDANVKATSDEQKEITAQFALEAAKARRSAYGRSGQQSDLEAARAYEALAIQARAIDSIRKLKKC
jgi:hypothetical protein